MKRKEKSFNNWNHNAIHLTFPNGNSISTTWAYCTYSDNHDLDMEVPYTGANFTKFMQSNTCEIMILSAPKKLIKKIQKKYNFEGDSVRGYLNITEWLDIVNMLANPNP